MEWGEHDLYEVLQVRPEDGPEVLRANYRRLALENHPDKHPQHKEHYRRKFELIANAFRVLMNPKLRALYDQVRARRQQVGDMVLERKRQVAQRGPAAGDSRPLPPVVPGAGPAAPEKIGAMEPGELAAQLARRRNETITVARDERLGKFDRDTFMSIFETEQRTAPPAEVQQLWAVTAWNAGGGAAGQVVEYNAVGPGSAFAPLDSAFELAPRIDYQDVPVKQRLAEYERLSSELESMIPQHKAQDVIKSLQQ